MTAPSVPTCRLLVVAKAPPLESSGTSVVLRRLLENLDADEVIVLARSADRECRIDTRPFPYPVVEVPSAPAGIRGDRYWRLWSAIPGVIAGRRAMRQHQAHAILAMFPDETALLTGYWLQRVTGLPLLVYLCDLYMEDRSGWEGWLARWLQPRVFKAAARVMVVNEGMASFYRERYGIEAVCLPTCINVAIPDYRPSPAPGRPLVVGYDGNINATRMSSLQALLQAIGGNPAYAIRYFTPQTPDYLRANGLWADNTSATFIADENELIRELAACDVLFLPLTFEVNENSSEQLSTCFGTKSFEYFLSQKPVLLHSPGDYFIARFYRQWNCGLVVDDPGAQALLVAIETLRDDVALRERLVRNALRAAEQFEGARVVARLRATLAEILSQGERVNG